MEKSRCDALEARCKEQGEALQAVESRAMQSRDREEYAIAERDAVLRDNSLLRARLESKDMEEAVRGSERALPTASTTARGGERTLVVRAGMASGSTSSPSSPRLAAEGSAQRGDATPYRYAAPGAPSRAEGAAARTLAGEAEGRRRPTRITLNRRFLFADDGGVLLPTAGPLLDRIAGELSSGELQEAHVCVQVRADSIDRSGLREGWELMGRQAVAVLEYLAAHEVRAERLSFGGLAPKSRCAAREDGLEAERCVELVVASEEE